MNSLQQNNPSTESQESLSLGGSFSIRADNTAVIVFAGLRAVAIGSRFTAIYVELVRLKARFPNFNIDLIDVEDRPARPVFLQYISEVLDVSPRGRRIVADDIFEAIVRREQELEMAEEDEERERERQAEVYWTS